MKLLMVFVVLATAAAVDDPKNPDLARDVDNGHEIKGTTGRRLQLEKLTGMLAGLLKGEGIKDLLAGNFVNIIQQFVPDSDVVNKILGMAQQLLGGIDGGEIVSKIFGTLMQLVQKITSAAGGRRLQELPDLTAQLSKQLSELSSSNVDMDKIMAALDNPALKALSCTHLPKVEELVNAELSAIEGIEEGAKNGANILISRFDTLCSGQATDPVPASTTAPAPVSTTSPVASSTTPRPALQTEPAGQSETVKPVVSAKTTEAPSSEGESKRASAESSESEGFPLWILIVGCAVFLVLLGMAALMCFVLNRKKKGGNQNESAQFGSTNKSGGGQGTTHGADRSSRSKPKTQAKSKRPARQ
eukprot:GEMP01028320.1.p1 GENE.GEMP01028320.1~~GEMP01028320.1.p1  ORF type:complete len:359 (+),score=61.51 GEMP01028320.1:56-1132(+)